VVVVAIYLVVVVVVVVSEDDHVPACHPMSQHVILHRAVAKEDGLLLNTVVGVSPWMHFFLLLWLLLPRSTTLSQHVILHCAMQFSCCYCCQGGRFIVEYVVVVVVAEDKDVPACNPTSRRCNFLVVIVLLRRTVYC
jgi:hypothetical protein